MAKLKTFEAYGLQWLVGTTALQIHFHMITRGDEWLKHQGRSLFFHFKEAFKILWPDDENHRWSDLILQRFCENEILVLIGCSDSGKTFTISKIALVDYWAAPDKTLWLVSTTEGRGSELRIWGVIKDLFNKAKERFPELAGTPVDYLKTITTGEVDEDGKIARSLNKGLIVVPCKTGGLSSGMSAFQGIKAPRLRHAGDEVACFSAGTLVDTPTGQVPIEQIAVGDYVLNALGVGRVAKTHKNKASSLVRVKTKSGLIFYTTSNHKFFTQKGWIEACNLNGKHYFVSHEQTMQIMREGIQRENIGQILHQMPQCFKKMPRMQSGFSVPKVAFQGEKVLQQVVSGHMASKTAGISCQDSDQGNHSQEVLDFEEDVFGKSRLKIQNIFKIENLPGLRSTVFSSDKFVALRKLPTTKENLFYLQKGIHSKTIQYRSTILQRELLEEVQWEEAYSCGGYFIKNGRKIGLAISNHNQRKSPIHGRSSSVSKISHRSGRSFAPLEIEEENRSGERKLPKNEWVDCVEILEQRDFEEAGFGDKEVDVYNLTVTGHPSYSILGGLICHNCMTDAFLNAYANWWGRNDFKGIMAGNFMEVDDPLGVAAEPKDGWDAFVDNGKTQEWDGKFYGAHVVALDGRDSPNFDYPETPPRFPFLITRKKFKGVVETKGDDSWEYWSQCVGKPMKGMDVWRVLSKGFADQRHASEDVVWKGLKLTSLYSLDPAYGGGDRCVGRRLDFGESVEGFQILRVSEPEIIPVYRSSKFEPEEQIATFIFSRLGQLSIEAQNCFYDSFGRGTLGFAFAKLFGARCPVPIDSGAQPTTRPVRFDLFVEEKDGRKRLKRCDEQYIKFITEMWFSVREIIDSEQLRNVDVETIREGCSRKFKKRDNKLEVEPKDEIKQRLGKSPDLMDNLAIGVEGARRLGFKIQKIGATVVKSNKPDWLEKYQRDYQEMLDKRLLQTA